jgi:hypothetical protein
MVDFDKDSTGWRDASVLSLSPQSACQVHEPSRFKAAISSTSSGRGRPSNLSWKVRRG